MDVGGSMGRVTNAPVLELHEVENITTAPNEEKLHRKVIERDPFREHVEIAGDEDGDVESLCFERYT